MRIVSDYRRHVERSRHAVEPMPEESKTARKGDSRVLKSMLEMAAIGPLRIGLKANRAIICNGQRPRKCRHSDRTDKMGSTSGVGDRRQDEQVPSNALI